ncbi:hypothetical protein BDR07DRAFT_1331785 [Suillus spraguei]|nr:hypothetical protein BDR07DRAFT_1331785 [Suillus spraguei]
MLIVHPSSCCDICLDPYITSDLATSPHAIECGHIFCLGCLHSLNTSTCPLCRELFDLNCVKKLHVGNSSERENTKQDAVHDHAEFLLHRISLVSCEGVPEIDVVEVVSEVQEWLLSQPDDPSSHIPLRAALDSLQRYKVLQYENELEKAECRRLRDQLRDGTLTTDHESRTSRAVEGSIIRIEEIEIERALTSRAVEDNLARIEEIDIEHALEVIIWFPRRLCWT